MRKRKNKLTVRKYSKWYLMHFTCKKINAQYFRISFHLHRNPLDEQCNILVNIVFTFRSTWKISFWQRFSEEKYVFRKRLLEALQVGAKRSRGNGWRFRVLTFATRDLSGETLLSLTEVGANCMQVTFQMPNIWLQKCEENLFSSVQWSLWSLCFPLSVIHTQIPLAIEIIVWRIYQPQYGKKICIRCIFLILSLFFLSDIISSPISNESNKSFPCVLPLWSLVGRHKLSDYCCYTTLLREGLNQIWNPGKVKKRKI